jgi:hypothetical protein
MKKYIATLILFIAVCLCGCSAINETLGLAKDLGITFSKDEAKEQNAIDSVTVNFKSAYWSEKIDLKNYEQDLYINGYHIWILQTDSTRRIEIVRADTVLKFYRK